ncbi:homoprotocatechuate degradation operon regulator HpaR [Paracoccus tegillarcae]|uniref:Homoprotocatechuate degradation operon regulator HpaR n=2 Tax=Paracoccus tegillarcae TaxID=1529068 RepID=A0A2K9EUG3_9RHOB|nr:homoprotocatechuate degradation operon regulator HpaR [Paracoccus tegillarcae]
MKPSTELPTTARSLPIALMRAREKVMAPIREMLAHSGITEQQWRILRVLSEHGDQEASKLAERASLLLPSQTRILQSMLEKGYVTRTASETDRRRQTIGITPKGQAIIKENLPQAIAISDRFRQALGPARYDLLLDCLEELEERL